MSLPDGKRKSIYGKSYREVERKLAQVRRDLDSGLPIVAEKQSLQDYMESWYQNMKHQIEPSTHRRYGNSIRLYIIPAIGNVTLSKVTPQQVQSLYSSMFDRGLSSSTVHLAHAVLHHALKDAVALGLIQRNVASIVKAPKIIHREMAPLTKEQARAMLLAAVGDRFEALFVLALSTGMREGEIFALKWQNVDLDKATLWVRLNLKEKDGGLYIAKPKTPHSRRSILLSTRAVEALRSHRIRQDKERSRLGETWKDNDFVFPNSFGGWVIPKNFTTHQYRRILQKANLPSNVRFHDLRHTAATLLLAEGVNVKVVSEMLGHADISITLRIYAHVIPQMSQGAADMMDDILG